MRLLELVVLVGVVGAGALVLTRGSDDAAAFAGDPQEFFVAPAADHPEVAEFQRRGRVLVLDADTHRVDPVHALLPPEVRADRADQVGTVGLVRCEESFSGYYIPYLVRGYNRSCRVQLIALPSRVMLADLGAAVSPPARVRLPFWNRHAPRPNAHLAAQIAALQDRGPEPAAPPR